MRELKIGLVLDDSLDTPDGVQQYVLAIGNWLSAQGNEVHYLVGETKRSDIEHVHSLSRNLKVRFNGNRLSIPFPTSRRKLRHFLETENFDVLHVQMPYSPMLAQRIIQAAPKSTAIVGTFHVLPYSRAVYAANHVLSIWLRSSLGRFDSVFAVSLAAQDFITKVYHVESTVLPNVTDVARFRDAKPLPQYAENMLTIMFLGRLVPRKGCRTLLEAVAVLSKQKLPPFRVVVCGKGPLDAELKRYASDHNLDNLVSFTGFVSEDDKPRYVRSADIMTFPSSGGESFGIVLIEAMAAGAVTLGGDNPGYASVLAPKPELLFKPNDAQALADKLAHFINDPIARKQITAWEHDYVRQFDVAAVGQKLLIAYDECCRMHKN